MIRAQVAARLGRAGFVAPEDEAEVLVQHAAGDRDRLEAAVQRRLTGEPLAWIVEEANFAGLTIGVRPGVYVPRPHTESLVRRAIERLPDRGVAVEICTGSGAIACVLRSERPQAHIVATEIDPIALTCARANGVHALEGDLFAPLPNDLTGIVDVVIGVVPYVPSPALALLQRDTLSFESPRSYDGGGDGTRLLQRAIGESPSFLRPGGTLLLEIGADQESLLCPVLEMAGFELSDVLFDDDGDVRGIEASWQQLPSPVGQAEPSAAPMRRTNP